MLGNNGSGKTTLINLLTGLTQPDSNSGDTSIRINKAGKLAHLSNKPKEFRSYVRLCQQNDFLFEELTVKEHL